MIRLSDLFAKNPLVALLVGLVRIYQRFISPGLPRSCKYYPSCSQYAIDALVRYGALRGTVLTVWRLMRCNPWSYGGYDPVERQKVFRGRLGVPRGGRLIGQDSCSSASAYGAGRSAGPSRRRRTRSMLLVSMLVVMLLGVVLFSASCAFFPATNTSTTQSTTVPGETTTTVLKEDVGFMAGPLKPLQALFFWILEFFHDNLNVSWSWAIVLLTVVVRVVLVPLTWRQTKSMRAMQALQPQIQALQEKYKDNRELLNQKTMEFYRENKVSPFGSCLPLLLQLPVFIGLYYMLMTAGTTGLDPETAGRWAGIFAPATPGSVPPVGWEYPVGWLWIPDITKFDYVLMFVYIASQFVASWQMARKGAGQQKMIAYFMPIMVGIFMFIGKWPSGLFIYWITSNLWTIAQQFVLEKFMPSPLPGGAAAAAAGSGKSGRGTQTKQTKPGSGKAGAAKSGAAKSGSGAKPGPKRTPSKATTVKKPAGQTGGKTSGQKSGKQGQAGSKGQRPKRGAGGPKGSGGA